MPDASTGLNQHLTSDKDSSELGELVGDERSSDTPATVMGEMESSQLGEAIEGVMNSGSYAVASRHGESKNPTQATFPTKNGPS